jgi:ribonuclease-3
MVEMNAADLPYNTKNALLAVSDVVNILTAYGVDAPPKNIDIYRKAFVHKSYCTRKNENFVTGNTKCPVGCLPLQEDSNERLEFLGDAILNVTVATYLFERYPSENEGFLTRMRTKLVNGKMLAHLSKIVGLEKFILMSKQIEEGDGRSNTNILEDTLEANLDFSDLVKLNNNMKDIILKYYQQNFGYTPKFYEIDVTMEGKIKMFKVCLKDINGTIISDGSGRTKKEAEQDAAKKAIMTQCPEYLN